MPNGIQSRGLVHCGKVLLPILAAILLPLAMAELTSAQIHGIPPSVTSIQNHFPPYLPNVRPSVTSLGPLGFVGPPAFPVYTRPFLGAFPGRHGWGSGYKNGFGGGFIAPFYVPITDASFADDPAGTGPYVYSGPPPEQTLHIVVDTAPARRDVVADEEEDVPAPPAAKSKHEVDAQPTDPTVLVFRDGHHQEVTNYAIMGQTVYVFDYRTQKIGLGDLDIPATIKLNDDRGVEFQLPGANHS